MPKFIHASDEEKTFSQSINSLQNDWGYALDRTLLDIIEQIAREMEKKDVSKVILAEKLGVSRAYITQLLSGKPNLQLNTLFKVAFALGLKPKIDFENIETPYTDQNWNLIHQVSSSVSIKAVQIRIKSRKTLNEYEPSTRS